MTSPTSFDADGFLAIVTIDTPPDTPSEWRLFLEVNRVAHEFVRGVEVDSRHPQKLFAVCLFLRLLEVTQSATLLARVGLPHGAAALLRVAFEALVQILNCCIDPTFPKAMVAKGTAQTLKRVRLGVPNDTRADLDAELRARLEAAEAALSRFPRTAGVGDPALEKLAQRVGLGGLYDTAYRMFCASTHVEANTLVDYLPDGDSEALTYGPRYEYSSVYLWSAAYFLLSGLDAVAKLLEQPLPSAALGLRERVESHEPSWPEL